MIELQHGVLKLWPPIRPIMRTACTSPHLGRFIDDYGVLPFAVLAKLLKCACISQAVNTVNSVTKEKEATRHVSSLLFENAPAITESGRIRRFDFDAHVCRCRRCIFSCSVKHGPESTIFATRCARVCRLNFGLYHFTPSDPGHHQHQHHYCHDNLHRRAYFPKF